LTFVLRGRGLDRTFSKSAGVGLPLYLLEYFTLTFKKKTSNRHLSVPMNRCSKVMVTAGVCEMKESNLGVQIFSLCHTSQLLSHLSWRVYRFCSMFWKLTDTGINLGKQRILKM